MNETAGETLFPEANSWYVGANITGKPRVFASDIGGAARYREKYEEVVLNGYEGFVLGARAR